MRDKIGVIGAGAWGTALSKAIAERFREALLWAYEPETANQINQFHENKNFLEGVPIPENVVATNSARDFDDLDLVVNVVPVQLIRQTMRNFEFDLTGKKVVNCSKGIEQKSLLRVSQIFEDAAGVPSEMFCVLTGPSHAEEVALNSPTTVVAASENIEFAIEVQKMFSTDTFRVYSSEDVIGCELGGSLKNVFAVAAGIVDGLKLGDNAKAALTTRGLAEMSRLGISMGANSLTFSGLSGLGDLFVTCNSRHSRNRYVGEQIGIGKKASEVIAGMKSVAEGVATTESAFFLGKLQNVEMPIVEKLYNIIFKNERPLQAIKDLMRRRSKKEWWK